MDTCIAQLLCIDWFAKHFHKILSLFCREVTWLTRKARNIRLICESFSHELFSRSIDSNCVSFCRNNSDFPWLSLHKARPYDVMRQFLQVEDLRVGSVREAAILLKAIPFKSRVGGGGEGFWAPIP